jgi:predicted RNA-binding Zn ribbon-like protein
MGSSAEHRRLAGGALCLDFANSVDWAADGTERPPETDALQTAADVVTWGRRVGVIGQRTALAVTDRELGEMRTLRAAVHGVFTAAARRDAPDPCSLGLLDQTLAQAVAAGELRDDGGWTVHWPAGDPRRVRFAVAVDAFDLLRDRDRLDRVRICPGRNCGWLFLDTSGRRRWCSMDVCGSRAKMRRHYERRRNMPTKR